MTEADKIYGALVGDTKKYGFEHATQALNYYIVEGDKLGFTSDNNARALISELTPPQVMAETFRGFLKYQMISKEKGLPKFGSNEQEVLKAIYEFNQGKKISGSLGLAELEELVKMMLEVNVGSLVELFGDNLDLFQEYITFYSTLLLNYRNDMNKIDNSNFPQINEYFDGIEREMEGEKQK